MNIYALLAGLFSGILGSMGFGGGTVLIIYLSLFANTEQLKSQGINLLFFIPCALLSIIIYSIKKQIRWKIVLKLAVFGVLGSFLGLFLADILGADIIKKIFGIGLILLAIKEFFGVCSKNVAPKTK